MKLRSHSFADGARIPEPFAFGKLDPATHVALSANRNPHAGLGRRAGGHLLVRGDLP
jgi:hypothetical protein